MTESAKPWRVDGRGLLLRVRLTPRGGRDGVEGIETTADGLALKVRVRAVPEDGAANAAAEAVVAQWLGLPKSRVGLASGARSRVKVLLVDGDGQQLAALAEKLFDKLPGRGP